MSEQQFCENKRNYDQIGKPSLIEAKKRKGLSSPGSNKSHPRWHNQAFMLYLALRQHPENSMLRMDLIKQALIIDKNISQKHMLPKVFRGKTPTNSASAVLTNNVDGYFVPFKPEGSRCMLFKLSFEPPTFDSAFREYQKWQENLMKYDWPCHFGASQQARKRKSIMSISNLLVEQQQTYATEFDEFIAKRRCQEKLNKKLTSEKTVLLPPTSWKDLVYSDNCCLFAKRFIPKNTPLGFYFGIPTSESEFEALKELHYPSSSRYAYMYQTTVIDPTDEQGELYKDICPFYDVKVTSIPEEANVVFYEGEEKNQIVCWAKQDIFPDQELHVYSSEVTATNNTPFRYQYTETMMKLQKIYSNANSAITATTKE